MYTDKPPKVTFTPINHCDNYNTNQEKGGGGNRKRKKIKRKVKMKKKKRGRYMHGKNVIADRTTEQQNWKQPCKSLMDYLTIMIIYSLQMGILIC